MKLKIHANLVLIHVAGGQFIDKVRGIFIDTSWKPEAHHRIIGVVESVPEKLLFYKKEIDAIKKEFSGTINAPQDRIREIQEMTARSMEFDVPIEIEKGDTVFFRYNVYAHAREEGRVFEQDKNTYILIPYDQLFIAIRGEKIIPLNGLVLIEPIMEKKSEIIITLEKEDSQIGKIAHLGCLVKSYLQFPEETDEDFFEVGDYVVFRKAQRVPLEFSIHRNLDKKYYKMNRWCILGKIKNFTEN